ncbi:MAG: Uma2 family endonuclease [Planctomycetes bacterium]|nr:Uma2 family endonuclease [Planctomycetota bacterium]
MRTMSLFGLEIPTNIHTLAGFRRWVGTLDERAPRVHYYRGRVHIEMSPQDYEHHGPVVAAINDVLGPLARELAFGRFFEPPSWITDAGSGISTEPDGFFIFYDSFRSGRVRINPRRKTELLGRPDMVLEAVSKTTARKDLVDLMEGYARAGVPEYWVADTREEKTVFRILVLSRGGKYRDQKPARGGWISSPTWRRSFRLVRFTDPGGLMDCRLEARRR